MKNKCAEYRHLQRPHAHYIAQNVRNTNGSLMQTIPLAGRGIDRHPNSAIPQIIECLSDQGFLCQPCSTANTKY